MQATPYPHLERRHLTETIMKLDLTGKRALIAGGSRGIGLAIADAYAQAGADVSICARTEGPLREAELSLKKHGHKVLATPCDLGDANACPAHVAVVENGGQGSPEGMAS